MKEIVVGIDIGGTNTVFGLIDKQGNCLFKQSIKTKKYNQAEDLVLELAAQIKKSLLELDFAYDLKGFGIGAPNGNFFKGTIEFAPNLGWHGVIHLTDMLGKYFPEKLVLLTNDANAAALGEMIYGAARGMCDFIVITLGTGLGSGIVSNGELIYGHDSFAGEIGHTIVYPDGRICGCGRKGCLETYASATGIVKTMIELLEKSNKKSSLRKLSISQITSMDIYNAAKDGDELALEAFDFTCKILGFKLADAVAYTSPEAIILFGGLAQAEEFIFEPTKRYMEENLLEIYKNKVKIIPSQIEENNAAILGASALIWKNIETTQNLICRSV